MRVVLSVVLYLIVRMLPSTLILHHHIVHSVPGQAVTAVATYEGWNDITLRVECAHSGIYGRIWSIEVAVGWSKSRALSSSVSIVDGSLGHIRRGELMFKVMGVKSENRELL